MAVKRRMDWDPFLQAARAGASAMEVEATTESYRLAGRGGDANPAGSPDADRIARQVAQRRQVLKD